MSNEKEVRESRIDNFVKVLERMANSKVDTHGYFIDKDMVRYSIKHKFWNYEIDVAYSDYDFTYYVMYNEENAMLYCEMNCDRRHNWRIKLYD